jgi:hypothetical protein
VIPPGATCDDFVVWQDVTGFDLRLLRDPTVQGGEIDPGEFQQLSEVA